MVKNTRPRVRAERRAALAETVMDGTERARRWQRSPVSATLKLVQACCDVQEVADQQRWVLRTVLWVNAAMFVIESMAGVLAQSTALLYYAATGTIARTG